MRRRCAAMLAFVLLLLQGCGNKSQQGDTVKVYYLRDISGSAAESAVEAVDVQIPQLSNKAYAAMNKLFSDPHTDNLISPFPKGMVLKGIERDGDKAVVSLSDEYGKMRGAELAAADACTVMTLCGIDGISSVKITVDGNPHPSHEKEYLSKDDIVTDDLSLKPVTKEAVLYFSDGVSNEYVVPELRNIIIRENESIERYVVEELIKGPSEENLKRIINPNTTLISIAAEKKTCYVNFSADFIKGISESRDAEIQTLYSVTNSLTEIEGVEGVQFLVENKPIYGDTVMHRSDAVIGKFYDPSLSETLYIPDRSGKYLEPVPTRIETSSGYSLERLIVERLITGIDGNGFLAVLPKGTMLIGTDLLKNTCYLNFSEEFTANDRGAVSRDLLYQSIALSLTEANENIENVVIRVNGNDINNGEPIYPDRRVVKK